MGRLKDRVWTSRGTRKKRWDTSGMFDGGLWRALAWRALAWLTDSCDSRRRCRPLNCPSRRCSKQAAGEQSAPVRSGGGAAAMFVARFCFAAVVAVRGGGCPPIPDAPSRLHSSIKRRGRLEEHQRRFHGGGNGGAASGPGLIQLHTSGCTSSMCVFHGWPLGASDLPSAPTRRPRLRQHRREAQSGIKD